MLTSPWVLVERSNLLAEALRLPIVVLRKRTAIDCVPRAFAGRRGGASAPARPRTRSWMGDMRSGAVALIAIAGQYTIDASGTAV
jgi:hypothetical protein